MTTKHTLTPWRLKDGFPCKVVTQEGELIVDTTPFRSDPVSSRADAVFIVKACNAHDELAAFIRGLGACISANETQDFVINNLAKIDYLFKKEE